MAPAGVGRAEGSHYAEQERMLVFLVAATIYPMMVQAVSRLGIPTTSFLLPCCQYCADLLLGLAQGSRPSFVPRTSSVAVKALLVAIPLLDMGGAVLTYHGIASIGSALFQSFFSSLLVVTAAFSRIILGRALSERQLVGSAIITAALAYKASTKRGSESARILKPSLPLRRGTWPSEGLRRSSYRLAEPPQRSERSSATACELFSWTQRSNTNPSPSPSWLPRLVGGGFAEPGCMSLPKRCPIGNALSLTLWLRTGARPRTPWRSCSPSCSPGRSTSTPCTMCWRPVAATERLSSIQFGPPRFWSPARRSIAAGRTRASA